MADFDHSWVESGIAAGLERARVHPELRSAPGEEAHSYATRYLEYALSGFEEEVSERFVSLAAEITTLAFMARLTYEGESLLDEEDVLSFVSHLAAFVNSWNHEGR